MIQEPRRTYVLELWHALGPAAASFVLAGGQALKFAVPDARATKDFDFVLDVAAIRATEFPIAKVLEALNDSVVPESQNFQFEKQIPGTVQTMRVELLGPDELKRKSGFRIDVDAGVHARSCVGGGIALTESDSHRVEGRLPAGEAVNALVRVTRPHALVLLKCLAMDDRYRSSRGIDRYERDRDSARTHLADIVAILSAQPEIREFAVRFAAQLERAPDLRHRIAAITRTFFASPTSVGLLLYEEYLQGTLDLEDPGELAREIRRAQQLLLHLVFP